MGSELLLIGALSFVVTLVLALPGGAVLLGVTALLRLKPWASLLLFIARAVASDANWRPLDQCLTKDTSPSIFAERTTAVGYRA